MDRLLHRHQYKPARIVQKQGVGETHVYPDVDVMTHEECVTRHLRELHRHRLLSSTERAYLNHLLKHGDVVMDAAVLLLRQTNNVPEFHDTLLRICHGWRRRSQTRPLLEFIVHWALHHAGPNRVVSDEWDYLESLCYRHSDKLLAIWTEICQLHQHRSLSALPDDDLATKAVFMKVNDLLDDRYISKCSELVERGESEFAAMQQQSILTNVADIHALAALIRYVVLLAR